jgi:hypothetical protein
MGIEQSGNQAEDSAPTLGLAPTSDLNGSSTGEIIGPYHEGSPSRAGSS